MIRLRPSGRSGRAGFTVIELLIAMTVLALLAGALASAAPSARQVFDRVPAELDQEQRGRSAIDALSQALRSASSIIASGDPTALTVIIPVIGGGQAILADQSVGILNLAASPCPNVGVCGFAAGATAIITDGSGRNDVFTVATTSSALRRLTANRIFAGSYPAGSSIAEIDQYAYRLALQGDGSYSLIRETAAGAIQPVVDFVRDLSFTVHGHEVEVSLGVEAATPPLRRVLPDRVFKTSIRIRNLS
jgi:prepilin-type N-terminal cleavage/methylation domain-containing protein